MELSARHLIFHAAIMLLFGLLLGAPYARAIKRNAEAHITNSWRVAHASLPMGAILMLVTAALFPALTVSGNIKWAITIALVISAYGFCIALPLAAITGQRGLAAGKGLGQVVYLGNVIGAMGSLVAAVIFLYATFVSL